MVELVIGGKEGQVFKLVDSRELLAVRTKDRSRLRASRMPARIRKLTSEFNFVRRFRSAELDLYSVSPADALEVRNILTEAPEISAAGRVLIDPNSGEPFVYNERIYVSLKDEASEAEAHRFLSSWSETGSVERRLDYARYSFLLQPNESVGQQIFEIAQRLLADPIVNRCHPEFLRVRQMRGEFPSQWHLGPRLIKNILIEQHANVEAAWNLSRGDGIIIAIIDDGVDTKHPEFARKGKVVAEYDFTTRAPDGSPKEHGDNHGTACAGVACADGVDGASGVAPDAALIPIRMISDLGSIDESDAFLWAIDKGADVISCSWGPEDGRGVPQPMPDNTRQVIEQAVRRGRAGKGCAIVFAAGNGNESADLDGYASHPDVICVAACNDRGVRSTYSDMGNCVDCAFPSGERSSAIPPPLTPGIWTTDRRGKAGYSAGDYVDNFSGTSSSCPGIAGVVALMLAANPRLTVREVREILTENSDKIDRTNGNYGSDGHSRWYGYGRVNAERAVREALNRVRVV